MSRVSIPHRSVRNGGGDAADPGAGGHPGVRGDSGAGGDATDCENVPCSIASETAPSRFA